MKKPIETTLMSLTIWIFAQCLFPSSSFAHRLNIFAWLENNQVTVECDFGKNRPAQNAEVAIVDSDTGKRLLSGRTNEAGVFTFTVPDVVRVGHGLLIDVNAGQGHHNEWKMDASELYAASSLTAGFDHAAIEEARNAHSAAVPGSPQSGVNIRPQTASPPFPASATQASLPHPLTREEVRQIVDESIAQHLTPVRAHLKDLVTGAPGLGEIIGGLGWIIGIIGIILYFRSRKTSGASKG